MLRLLPTLTHLSANEKWRVRRSAVEVVPALVKSSSGMKARAEIGKLVVCVRARRASEQRGERSEASEARRAKRGE